MEKTIEILLNQLTLEEKITLCAGASTMKTAAIERLGIKDMEMADGPNGVRSTGQPNGEKTTALPAGIALAASFDTALAEKYGKTIALDSRALGITSSLGPGINLMRTPLCGRNFEYYGEDPFLAGKIAAGYIRGCQKEKVAATPKHLALNNQEICRTNGSSDIDERTLRELYLTAFEIATKEGHPWMMMSSYNRINGTYASQNGLTQELIAKREWGFDGVMVSDWGGAHDTVGCMLGGLDLEMPGPPTQFNVEKVLNLVKIGMIPESVIDDKVRRVLRLLYRTSAINGDIKPAECGGEEQQKIAAEAAAGSIVLLKNEDKILPLNRKNVRKIVVTGPNAAFRHHYGTLRYQGGSGAVNSEREVTLLDGLRSFAEKNAIELEYIPTIRFEHDQPCPPDFFGKDGIKCVYYKNRDAMKENRDVLFEENNYTGIWEFNTASAQYAGGDTSSERRLPKKGFALRVSTILNPPPYQKAMLIFAPQGDPCTVKLNGRTIWESTGRNLIGTYEPAAGEIVNAELEIEYSTNDPDFAGLSITWDDQYSKQKSIDKLLDAAKNADAVIFAGGRCHLIDKEAIGTGDVRNADMPDMDLPVGQDELIEQISRINPNTIVALIGGSVMNIERWIDHVPALFHLWYPGEAGGTVFAELLFGELNPAGRLPFSWAKDLMEYPCHANGNYPGNRTDPDPHVRYDEGIFIGYRHFDRAKTALRYPFGFGLSYSTFDIYSVGVKQTGDSIFDVSCEIEVTVKNTSEVSGTETVQIYTGAVEPEFERPEKELRAFSKVELAPGENKTLSFSLSWRDFACFHPDKHHWCVPAGNYRIYVCRNAAEIIDSAVIKIQ